MTNSENGSAMTLPTSIRVLLPNNQVEEMKLETYLAGAVAAEIGADAPLEALKAQAVASRTYVVSAQRHSEQNADVCTGTHCQKWKHVDPVTAPEVFRALSETWGMVAVHAGQLISAFFFEHCDGHTRNAEEMHIPALAYLRGVDCSCGFLTLKGHGVGMCKRGAVVMARRGASFEQILQHYYRGVSIVHTALEMPAIVERAESHPAPVESVPPAEIKPRTRTRKPKTPPVEAAESPKPKRRVTRRARRRVVEESPASQPVIEITAVPASVALKRIQIPPSERTAEVEPVAQAETPPSEPVRIAEEKPAPPPQVTAPAEPVAQVETPPSEPVQFAEEKPAPPPQATAPAEPLASIGEATPVNMPPLPRLELALPTRERAPTEPAAPASEPAPVGSWRLVKPEPIEPARASSTPPATPAKGSADETPSMIARRVHVDHLPGERMICGALPRAGVIVIIEDPHGENTIVYSGSASHYGEGGFEMMVAEDGKYLVTIGGKGIEVEVQSDTVFIHA